MKPLCKIGLVLLLVASGCSDRSPENSVSQPGTRVDGARLDSAPILASAATPSEWAKLKVDAQGQIYLDGEPITGEELSLECDRLKDAGGAIRIFVETASDAMPLDSEQGRIVAMIAEKGIPMQLVLNEAEL